MEKAGIHRIFCEAGLDQYYNTDWDDGNASAGPKYPSIAQADLNRLTRWESIVAFWKEVRQRNPAADLAAVRQHVVERWNVEKLAVRYSAAYPYGLSDSYVGETQEKAEQELKLAEATIRAHEAFAAGLIDCDCDSDSQLSLYAAVVWSRNRWSAIDRSLYFASSNKGPVHEQWRTYYGGSAGGQRAQAFEAAKRFKMVFDLFEHACHPEVAAPRWPLPPERQPASLVAETAK